MTFQRVDLQGRQTLFLSLATNRYLAAPGKFGAVAADRAGLAPDRKDGSWFTRKAAPHKLLFEETK
jgi:hypothetical protein